MKPFVKRHVSGALAFALIAVLTLTLGLLARSDVRDDHPVSGASPLKTTPQLFAPAPQSHTHNRVSVDGAVTPDQVPDDAAFSLFLRMTLRNAQPNAAARQRSYVRNVLREAHAGDLIDPVALDKEVELVVTVLQTLEPSIRGFDNQRQQLMSNVRLSAAAVVEARQHILQEARDTISTRLPPATAQRLEWYVRERFKTKVKIIY